MFTDNFAFVRNDNKNLYNQRTNLGRISSKMFREELIPIVFSWKTNISHLDIDEKLMKAIMVNS